MNEKKKQATKQITVKEKLQGELASWQTKIDIAKLQMQLGTKEVNQKIQPHVEQLEQELIHAKAKWEQLEVASEAASKDIKRGVSKSIKSMKMAFEKIEKAFSR